MPFLLLMPSYNQDRFIGEAVDSILAQDDPDWELWILDNSTDGTPERMARYDDPRIRFHHQPQRSDPGQCLNWMLERARGREFSYVHTDNRLLPGYVRAMRAALSDAELALAYCDMYLMDAVGHRTALYRRGPFDLPRLMSMSPLGVPFAATTALATALGGFSRDDVADDVLFCTRAHGLARYRYLREPLIDYRHHEASRSTRHGGFGDVQRAAIDTFRAALPELESRSLDPLSRMREALAEIAQDIRWAAEDQVLRIARIGIRWHPDDDPLAGLWRAGLVHFPGLERRHGAPSAFAVLRTVRAGVLNPALLLWRRRRVRAAMERVVAASAERFEYILLALAQLCAPRGADTFELGSRDPITLWAAALLEAGLGWKRAHPGMASSRADAAPGPEVLLLDLSGRAQPGAGTGSRATAPGRPALAC